MLHYSTKHSNDLLALTIRNYSSKLVITTLYRERSNRTDMLPKGLLKFFVSLARISDSGASHHDVSPVARSNSLRASSSLSDKRSVAQDENICHGVSGDFWVISRDVAVENAVHFCGQDIPIMRYNDDTVNELELEVKNWNTGAGVDSPRDAPDCVDRFTNAVLDGCDGNDMVNNPYNYKFGATLRTTDGWQYKMTPKSRQVNEVRCDISFRVGYDHVEVRGKNLPSALLGADGEGLSYELSRCGGLSEFHFEQTPTDPNYQWFAAGNLPQFFLKSCVGRAIQSAGGSSNGGCKRSASSIDDWLGYGDDYRHVFKHPA